MRREDYVTGYRDGTLDAINAAQAAAEECKAHGDMRGYFYHRKVVRDLQAQLEEKAV